MGDNYFAAIRQNTASHNGADLLRARAVNGRLTSERIADWLKDYSALQRKFVAELERFQTSHVIDEESLGTLAEPWQRVSFLLAEQHRSTSELAKRVQVEAERPIRELAFWSRAERVIEELRHGSSGGGSVGGQLVAAEECVAQFQQLDEKRIENLKNSLLRFATVEVDRSKSQLSSSERAMQAWLEYAPRDDIQSFVAQIISGVAPTMSTTEASSALRTVSGASGTSSQHGHGSGGHGAGGHSSALTGPVVDPNRTASTTSVLTQGSNTTSGSHHAPIPRQSSQTSQSTVRRRASMLLLGGGLGGGNKDKDSSDHPKSPGSNLRSKVGSIFGRKKKHPQSPSRGTAAGGSGGGHQNLNNNVVSTNPLSAAPAALTRPPDFGPRQISPAPSSTASPASSLRNLRMRDHDDTLYSSPERPRSPRRTATGESTATGVIQQQQGFFGEPSIAPLTPTKARPRSRTNSVTRDASPSTQQQQQPQQPQHPGLAGVAAVDAHQAPAPPPARSVHRQNSLNRTASSASARAQQVQQQPPVDAQVVDPQQQQQMQLRSNGTGGSGAMQRDARDARVASQVFTNLAPAQDSNRGSAIYGMTPQQQATIGDKLGPLPPIPATPQTLNTPGSPEQFWTPAQRFPPQFSAFEHGNTSLASISSSSRGGAGAGGLAQLPPLPTAEGLVASAVEHIEAEYDGDRLVRGSVRGEAVAQINGPAPTDTLVLGILLADPNSKLTPSPLLHQTSSLSFDMPVNLYSAANGSGGVSTAQELVQYHAESAVGRVPVKLTPVWRFDRSTVRLVLSFQLSDVFVGGNEVEIHDLVIAVSIRGTARAHAAQSKPVATFSRDKQRVTWRFNVPQVLRRGAPPTKLLCQFVTDGSGAAQPGTIDLKARLPVVSNSVLQLRTLSPQGEWVAVPTAVAGEIQSKVEDTTAPPPAPPAVAPSPSAAPTQSTPPPPTSATTATQEQNPPATQPTTQDQPQPEATNTSTPPTTTPASHPPAAAVDAVVSQQ